MLGRVGGAVLLAAARVEAHGTLNLPESRNGAQAGLGLRQGGRTQPYSVAYWFTDLTHMVGNATIADDMCPLLTCAKCEQGGCAATRLARTPWRSPGTAPLAGGPCGSIGWDGAVGRNASITRGTDLPPSARPAVWRIGGVERVAWGKSSNGLPSHLTTRSSDADRCCQQGSPSTMGEVIPTGSARAPPT